MHPAPQPNEHALLHAEQRPKRLYMYQTANNITAQTVKLLDMISDFTTRSKWDQALKQSFDDIHCLTADVNTLTTINVMFFMTWEQHS